MSYSTTQLENAIKHVENLQAELERVSDKITGLLNYFEVSDLDELKELLEDSKVEYFDFSLFENDLQNEFVNFDFIVEFYDCILGEDIFQELHLFDGDEITEEIIDKMDEVKEKFDELDSDLGFDSQVISLDRGLTEYLIVDDNCIDEVFSEYINELIDDVVLNEIPDQYHSYFDRESFTDDCKIDGYGHHLASYDGNEYHFSGYYVFRRN